MSQRSSEIAPSTPSSRRQLDGNTRRRAGSTDDARRGRYASPRPTPANAIGEERILDAAYELLLAIGMRRMTMADIARHAEVSRATLYRRWPNVQAVVAALMTREWTTALVSAFQPDSVDGRSRLVEGVVEVVAKTRTHPLMRKIIELDPEFLTPYLLERRGSSTVAHLALVKAGIEAGQADGSIRAGDPDWLSRQIILVSLASAVSGPVLAAAKEYSAAGRGAAGDADEVPDAMIAVGNASLNAARRTRELDWLDTTGKVDVLVIGGGVTGVGRRARRGRARADRCPGGEARPGLRDQPLELQAGARRAALPGLRARRDRLRERGRTRHPDEDDRTASGPPGSAGRALVAAGKVRAGGDAALAPSSAATCCAPSHGPASNYLPHSRRVSSAEILRYAPTVRPDGLRGGFLTWDGQLYDDARLVVAIARTAASYGARVLTHCAAEQVTGQGAVLVDQLSGRRIDVDARIVINAAGIWADQVASGIKLRPSRGTHLVFPQSAFGGLSAVLTVPVPGELRRVVMAIPAPDGRVYVGLTDEDAPGPVSDVPQATEAEIDFLLATISAAVRVPLTRADLLGTYAGLRPLLDTGHHRGEDKTADISRRHAVITSPDGIVTIVGGKLTTYRRMAQDVLDTALDAVCRSKCGGRV